ncbi:M28 family peptidase, partial [Thermus tenuipuniceus]|uniref:M28 family peptidase n=1 Tax=Thermus tenuipuniceus TaxID=2078690 RepID=UPI000CF9E579
WGKMCVSSAPFKDTRLLRQPLRSYGWELLGISLLLVFAPLSPWPPLLGASAFFFYFNGFRPWGFLLDRHPSQNLLAWKGRGGKALLLMAHVDTAKTFFLYHPKRVHHFRTNFLLNALLALLAPPLALTPLKWPVGLYFLAQAALLLHRELFAPYVEGGNDNGSGVAVATALFLETEPPEGWRLGLALTGCEEVGALGAKALLPHLPPGTLVLNLDNVGRGELFYAEGEGMLLYFPYRGALLEAARRTPGAKPLRYRLAYFDTLPLAQRGFPCLTLIRLEGGLPSNWHWPTDTFAQVDEDALQDTLAYARSLLPRAFASG